MKFYACILFVIFSISSVNAAGAPLSSATIYRSDGSSFLCDDVSLSVRVYLTGGIAVKAGFVITKDDSSYSIGMSKIDDNREVQFKGVDVESIALLSDDTYRVVLKNGNEATLKKLEGRAKTLGTKIYTNCIDSFTGKRAKEEFYWGKKPSNVIEVKFGEAGDIKYSPKSGTYFPVDFVFDPYTGERLEVRSSKK